MTRYVLGYAFWTSPVGENRTRVLVSENKKDARGPLSAVGSGVFEKTSPAFISGQRAARSAGSDAHETAI